MAMEGTHIRFALDIKDLLQPKHLDAYVAGSVYPDSRYVTGIDRLATHPKDYLSDAFFHSSDFKKGWLAHLLCDDIQYVVMGDLLPHVSEGTRGQGSETWVKRTAIKVLQDMDDVRKFDLAKYLPALTYFEAPSGESEAVLRSYYAMLCDNYAKTPNISISDEMNVWNNFSIGDELVIKVTETVAQNLADPNISAEISGIYDKTLAKVRSSYKVAK